MVTVDERAEHPLIERDWDVCGEIEDRTFSVNYRVPRLTESIEGIKLKIILYLRFDIRFHVSAASNPTYLVVLTLQYTDSSSLTARKRSDRNADSRNISRQQSSLRDRPMAEQAALAECWRSLLPTPQFNRENYLVAGYPGLGIVKPGCEGNDPILVDIFPYTRTHIMNNSSDDFQEMCGVNRSIS